MRKQVALDLPGMERLGFRVSRLGVCMATGSLVAGICFLGSHLRVERVRAGMAKEFYTALTFQTNRAQTLSTQVAQHSSCSSTLISSQKELGLLKTQVEQSIASIEQAYAAYPAFQTEKYQVPHAAMEQSIASLRGSLQRRQTEDKR
jgi:hypothetical protein